MGVSSLGARLNLLSVQDYRQFEEYLHRTLTELLPDDGNTPISAVIRRFVLQGGKRMRPQVCLWTYHTAKPTPIQLHLDRQALQVACAWELFHAFVLCHDDIIDNADQRRNQPSLHRQLAALDGDSLTFGRNLGIVAGDLLFGASMQLLHSLELPQAVHRSLLCLFSEVVAKTGLGQAMDVWQSHQPASGDDELLLLREYDLKTAAYTFEGPMLSGALIAGLEGSALEPLRAFSRSLGLAYQMHNDLMDLHTPVHTGCDLAQGKRTPTLLRARRMLDARQRASLDRLLDGLACGRGVDLDEAESIRQALLATPAVAETHRLINQALADAAAAADQEILPASLQHGITQWLRRLEEAYFRLAPTVL